MNLRVLEQNETGLNTRFINKDTGRTFSREHVIDQIRKGNSSYDHYQVVTCGSTTYVRSKPDQSTGNNIEPR